MANSSKPTATSGRKTRRAIGRPSDPARLVGRETLVKAACELLKTMPPAEFSGAKLASACGVDPSLPRYYFKDRIGLLIAAAEHLTTEFNPDAATQGAGDHSADKFRARVGRHLDLDAANPYFYRLMLEELLPSDSSSARNLLRQLANRGVDAYRSQITHGVENGEFVDTDVEMLFVTIVAVCQAFQNTHKLYEIATNRKINRERFQESYKQFLGDLLLRAISVR